MNLVSLRACDNDGACNAPADRATTAAPAENKVQEQVYEALADALILGGFAPLESMSLRSLAAKLKVSPMPVREAVSRLIAEKAMELQPSNNRLRVPGLSPSRLQQLMQARCWVEPELAYRAAGRMTRDSLRHLYAADEELTRAMSCGDATAFMRACADFHFTIYGRADACLFYDMARSLWLQSGPPIRVAFGRVGTGGIPRDHHRRIIDALEAGDAGAAQAAVASGIKGIMELVLAATIEAGPKTRRRG